MKELVRLQNIFYEDNNLRALHHYNLTIFQGEIFYLLGAFGSGKSTVEALLMGREIVQKGNIYWKEEKCTCTQAVKILGKFVNSISYVNPLVRQMSILENLVGIVRINKKARRKAKEKVKEILEKIHIELEPEAPVWKLDFIEEQLLGIVKYAINGKQLIILDCVNIDYGLQDAERIVELMESLKEKGHSFLIINDKCDYFLTIADRIQVIQQGKDMMEWKVEKDLQTQFFITRDTVRYLFEEVKQPHYNSKGMAYADKKIRNKNLPPIVFLLDMTWKQQTDVQQYLKNFSHQNYSFWKEEIDIDLLESGEYYDGKTAIIVQNSGFLLMENLPILENLIICAANRVSTHGMINHRLEAVVEEDFYRVIGPSGRGKDVGELSRVERKILSVYRWELLRPRAIILENPFWGMDTSDMLVFGEYLRRLKRQKIKVIVVTRYLEPAYIESDKKACDMLILAKEAKILKTEKVI